MTARPLRRTEVLGRRGEDAAAAYLRREGMRILDRNWRCRHGELDIVARDRGLLVAVEVKTRSSGRFGSPLEAIGPEKRARLHLLASTWAAEHTPGPRPGPVAPGAPPGTRPRTGAVVTGLFRGLRPRTSTGAVSPLPSHGHRGSVTRTAAGAGAPGSLSDARPGAGVRSGVRAGAVAPGPPSGPPPRGRPRPLASGPSRHPGRFTARAAASLSGLFRGLRPRTSTGAASLPASDGHRGSAARAQTVVPTPGARPRTSAGAASLPASDGHRGSVTRTAAGTGAPGSLSGARPGAGMRSGVRSGAVAPGPPSGPPPRGRARPLASGPSRRPGRFAARALALLDSAVRPRPRRTPRPRVRVDAVSVLLGADGRCYIRHHRGIA